MILVRSLKTRLKRVTILTNATDAIVERFLVATD